MTVAVGDVVRAVAEWAIPDGTVAQMVWHYIGASGTTATDAQTGAAVETAIDTAFNSIAASVSNVVLGTTVDTLRWDFTLNRFDGIDSRALIGADGSQVDDMLPHGAAALGKIFTTLSRRQSRKYVAGFAENQAADGSLNGAALVALANFLEALDNDIVAGGLTLEYGTFNSEPTSPLFETFANRSGSVVAEAIMAYQRRRRPGTGI